MLLLEPLTEAVLKYQVHVGGDLLSRQYLQPSVKVTLMNYDAGTESLVVAVGDCFYAGLLKKAESPKTSSISPNLEFVFHVQPLGLRLSKRKFQTNDHA